MSLVIDQVRLIDAQLDQLQLFGTTSAPSSPEITSISGASQNADVWGESHETPHVIQLQQAIKSISAASSSRLQLQSVQLQDILKQLQKLKPISSNDAPDDGQPTSSKEQELEWLLVSKTTAQVYGLVVNILLEQTIRLTRDIWYWDVILGSYSMTGLYSVQILPQRLWRWAREIYHDTRQRLQSVQNTTGPQSQRDTSIRDSWYRFYGLVKDSMRDHSITSMQSQLMSPLTLCRAGIRRKKSHLKRLREMSASSLGILMDEGLTFDMDDGTFTASEGHVSYDKEWRSVVSKSVTLMGTALQKVTILELGPSDFEESVFLCVDEDSETVQHRTGNEQLSAKSTWLANRLQQILSDYVPKHIATYEHLVAEHGKPSRIVRYWLPALMAILSSSTVLRICLNRKTEILEWIRDLGTTMRDFWYNWVVDPLKKVVGTIRHDEDSEVALMSKGSLEGDKASLERMVLDFVKDNSSSDTKFSDPEIASLRDKINEGDLTPVLKAYEKDLRRPIMGTIRGDLIRALLIQIQKTKVDIEVAVGGIDALLKSQELVFGFVALTPGVLVCVGILRYINGAIGGRKSQIKGPIQGQMVRNLRNIDRVLNTSTPSNNGMLSYKEHGLLLCEVHILRQNARQILPGEIHSEFVEELEDLVDLRTGIERQLRVIHRIRWAYSKWLSI